MSLSRDGAWPSVRAWVLQVIDRGVFPDIVMGANDGIVATAGIVEGFSATAASGRTVILAALASLTAGALSLGGAIYSEYSAQREAVRSTVEEERRRLASTPDLEFAQLEAMYVERGLSAELARQVAAQLTAHDALGAHIELEHSISTDDLTLNPVVVGVAAGLAFAGGSTIPFLAALFAPPAWRLPVIFLAAIVALCLTSTFLVRVGRASPGRTFVRALVVGVGTILVGLALGRLIG